MKKKSYIRICKKCEKEFNSETKFRKICDECKKSRWDINIDNYKIPVKYCCINKS